MLREFRVSVDEMLCVGHGWCFDNLPAVFRQDDAGQSQVIEPSENVGEDVIEAAENCPVGAIMVIDALTGEDALA